MKPKPISRRTTARWLGPALAVLAGWCCLILPVGEGLILRSYDLPFALAAPRQFDDVVIVLMDSESEQYFQQEPNAIWDRSIHARLVRRLAAQGARAVVFDVFFEQPSANTNADWELAQAVQDSGKVVLAEVVETTVLGPGRIQKRVRLPTAPLQQAAARLGAVELSLSSDRGPRQHYIDPDYPGLAWQAADLLNRAPPDRLRPRWINYYGAMQVALHLKYQDALAPELPADFFAGKVVFVGLGRSITPKGTRADEYRTPYTRWTGALMPGVEIQATIFLNLIHRDWLERLPPTWELLLVLLFGVVFGAGLPRARPVLAVGLSAGALLAIAALGILSARYLHWWFPWLVPCLVQIPLGLAVTLLAGRARTPRRSRRTKRKRAPRPAPPVSVPETWPAIPNYTLLKQLGEGGYGCVFLARGVAGDYCAIKCVMRKKFPNTGPLDREFNGVKLFVQICRDHPGLIHLLTVGRLDRPQEGFYYAMELADREDGTRPSGPGLVKHYAPRSLALEIARRAPLPLPECLDLGKALADALDFLHSKELIHRDIKPANIVYVRGKPTIADVGLVCAMPKEEEKVSCVGTIDYMAPEGPGQPAADVFSLGKVLEQAAFPNSPASSGKGSAQPPRDPQWERLHQIIARATADRVGERYASAAKLLQDLRDLQHDIPTKKIT